MQLLYQDHIFHPLKDLPTLAHPAFGDKCPSDSFWSNHYCLLLVDFCASELSFTAGLFL